MRGTISPSKNRKIEKSKNHIEPHWTKSDAVFCLKRRKEVIRKHMGVVKAGIRRYSQQLKELESLKGKSEKVIKRLMSDVRTRVPGWVASEVVKVYGIKKSEVMPAKAGKASKTAGSIKVVGDSVQTMQIIYAGRLLTPTHFSMTPKAPRETYTLKAEILRGQKIVLGKKKKLTKKQLKNIGKNFTRQGKRNSDHSPIMLMRTGNTYIPFQRKSQDRDDVIPIKTISVPQMVSSDRANEQISRAINDGLEKRMKQHMKILDK